RGARARRQAGRRDRRVGHRHALARTRAGGETRLARRDTTAPMRRVLRTGLFVAAALALAGSTGCVTSGTHKKKIAELDKKYDDAMAAAKQREDDLRAAKADLEKQLSESTSLVSTLTRKLEELGQNVDSLTREKGQLAASVA